MFNKKQTTPIGELLVKKRLIRKRDLNEALELQERHGSRLGEILLGQGRVGAYKLYKVLAEQLGLAFVDLEKEPCDPLLLEHDECGNYLKFGVIPWQRRGKVIMLAVTDVTPELEAWATEKYAQFSVVVTSPYDILWAVQRQFEKEDDEEARETLWKNNPRVSAKHLFLTPKAKNLTLLTFMVILAMMFFKGFIVSLFIALNLLYFTTLAFKVLFVVSGWWVEMTRTRRLKNAPSNEVPDKDLPVYTLLVPLYHEKYETIKGLVNAIRELNYPKSKLDVELIVEGDDILTIDNIKLLQCESIFRIIRVPPSLPRTKPKACNYALKFAKGDYVTIYDAEDRPDPEQLRKVLQTFHRSDDKVVCVQSRLNYYNRRENLLTRMFSLEYGSWFDFMLPGLEALKVPIPLGGTSNHFPVKVLRELYAWDPYNVTEDADLGLRIAQRGYRTTMVDSTTLEEAPVGLATWMKQRARWIKGYLQTFIVHMRHPLNLVRAVGIKGFLGFLFFVGAPSLVFLTLPFALILSSLMYFHQIDFPSWMLDMLLFNFIAGVLAHIVLALMVVVKHGWWGSTLHSLIFPFYWVLHTIASFKAVWQLVTKPHFWDKTEHGLSRMAQPSPKK